MTREAHSIILRPVLTEKLTELRETQRKIGILVRADANKVEMNVLNGQGKIQRIGRMSGKKPDWKKAIVTMKAGEKLEMFEGV